MEVVLAAALQPQPQPLPGVGIGHGRAPPVLLLGGAEAEDAVFAEDVGHHLLHEAARLLAVPLLK